MCFRDCHLSGGVGTAVFPNVAWQRSTGRTAHLTNHTDRCAMDLATSRG